MSVIVYQFQTVKFIQMMSLTFGLFTQVSGSGPLGPLVVISGQWKGDNKRLCAIEPCLQSERLSLQVAFDPGTTRPAGQALRL